MTRARISKSHHLQFSCIGNLNAQVHVSVSVVSPHGWRGYRAVQGCWRDQLCLSFCAVCPPSRTRSGEALPTNSNNLLLTLHFFHLFFMLCPSREYGSAFFNPSSVICDDTRYRRRGGSKRDPTAGLWLLPSNSIHLRAGGVLFLPSLEEQMLIFFTCDSGNWIIGADLTRNARITKSQEFSR